MDWHSSNAGALPRDAEQAHVFPAAAPYAMSPAAPAFSQPLHRNSTSAYVTASTSTTNSNFFQSMPPPGSMVFTMGQSPTEHAGRRKRVASQPPRFRGRSRRSR